MQLWLAVVAVSFGTDLFQNIHRSQEDNLVEKRKDNEEQHAVGRFSTIYPIGEEEFLSEFRFRFRKSCMTEMRCMVLPEDR